MLEDQTVADRDPTFRLAVEAEEQWLVRDRLRSERHRRKWNVVAKQLVRDTKKSDAALMACFSLARHMMVYFPNPPGKRRPVDDNFVISVLSDGWRHLKRDAISEEVCEQVMRQHEITNHISREDIQPFKETAHKRLGLYYFRGPFKETPVQSSEPAEAKP